MAYNETPEWIALQAAQAAFDADGTVATLPALEAAEATYFGMLAAAKARFEALNLTDIERMTAEENADDTEGTSADRLRWFQIAFYTGQEIIDFRPSLSA